MILDATIQAGRLQHAIKVLRRVNDEVILEISEGAITSRVVNPANAMSVQVDIDAAGGHILASEPHTIGIDLEHAAGFVMRAAAKDDVRIIAEDRDSWQMTRGVHQRVMTLLEPGRVRKYPDRVELLHTATVRMTGKLFKEIIAEAAALKTNFVTAHATEEKLTIEAVSEDTTDKYRATLLELVFEGEATCKYDCDYLQDIAADIRAKDVVMFSFSTDYPCEIEYERDGVRVAFMLAPRIRSN